MKNPYNKMKGSTTFLLFLLTLFCSPSVQAAEREDSHHAPASHQTEQADTHHEDPVTHTKSQSPHNKHGEAKNTHKNAHHKDGHNGQIPPAYYTYWFFLTITFIIVFFYCLWIHKKGKPAHEGLWLARILVVFAIALYALDQFPELRRHFDPAIGSFVDGYHEPTATGAVKLVYKIGLGVLLMIYGLAGRKEH